MSCHMRIEEIIDEVWVDLEKCGVPRPGYVPTEIPSIKITTASSIKEANVALDEGSKSSAIYEDTKAIVAEVAAGLPKDGSSLELTAISGDEVCVKLEGPVANGMLKDMTLNFIATKLKEKIGREIKVVTR